VVEFLSIVCFLLPHPRSQTSHTSPRYPLAHPSSPRRPRSRSLRDTLPHPDNSHSRYSYHRSRSTESTDIRCSSWKRVYEVDSSDSAVGRRLCSEKKDRRSEIEIDIDVLSLFQRFLLSLSSSRESVGPFTTCPRCFLMGIRAAMRAWSSVATSSR
jgi:hypothetical protein